MTRIRNLFAPTDAALVVLATGSGIYSYLGCRQLLDGESLFVLLAAIVYAGCISLMIALFWMWAMRVLPTTQSPKRLLWGFLTVLVGVITICMVSSSFNATALFGPAALKLHESRALSASEQHLDTTHRATLQMRDLLPDLRSDAERFRKMEADERENGRFTLHPGDGAVAELFGQASRRLGQLADTVESALTEIKDLRDEAVVLIADMRDPPSSVNGMERRERFRQLAIELYAVIAKMRAAIPAGTVKRTAVYLVSELLMQPPAINKALRDKQHKVADQIKATLQNTAQKLAERAGDIAKLLDNLPERPKFEPMHAIEAVFAYAGEFVPAWIGAIAIDLMPLLLLIFIVIAERNFNDGESGPRNPIMDRSVDEYMKYKELEKQIRNSENVRSIHHERAS